MDDFDKFFDKQIFSTDNAKKLKSRSLRGRRVGVIGGDSTGVEAALTLRRRGNTVILFEWGGELLADAERQVQLACTDIRVLTNLYRLAPVGEKRLAGVAILQQTRWGLREGVVPLEYLFVCRSLAAATKERR